MCDYEMPVFYKVKLVKIRKTRKCCECGEIKNPSETMERATGKWDGDIKSFYTCERCVTVRQAYLSQGFSDCFAHGGLYEEIHDSGLLDNNELLTGNY